MVAFIYLSEGVCGSLVTTVTISGERQQLARWNFTRCRTSIGEEPLSYDFGLLLKSVAAERLAWLNREVVAAKGMAHQRQVKPALGLRLPHVCHFVDEESLPGERLFREVLRPAAAVRMEIDVAHWRHRGAARLERPPFALDEEDARYIDRFAEDGADEIDLSRRQMPRAHQVEVAGRGAARHLRRSRCIARATQKHNGGSFP